MTGLERCKTARTLGVVAGEGGKGHASATPEAKHYGLHGRE